MSLCFCSISKPSFLNREPDSITRWNPNPKTKHLRIFNIKTYSKNLGSCPRVKAVNEDGVGVVYPDDTVSERNASLDAEREEEVLGVVNGVSGTVEEEARNEIRFKKNDPKSEKIEENDVNSRFKLRNGREVFEEKAYIVGVERKGDDTEGSFGIEESLSELGQLADTAGLLVVGSTYQKLATRNPRTYIGSGKVAEIKSAIRAFDVETVIFDNELSPGLVSTGFIQSYFIPCLNLQVPVGCAFSQ